MIYSKKAKLDRGNPIEMRVLKTEKLRVANHDLKQHLKQYVRSLEMQIHTEKLILEDLNFIYSGECIYSHLMQQLETALEFKKDILSKAVTSLKQLLESKDKINENFHTIKPYIKKYLESKKKLGHYQKKLPKVKTKMDAKTKLQGMLSNKQTSKLIRNEKKLVDAGTNLKLSGDKIIEETNRVNLKRFEIQNPMMKEFISSQITTCYMMNDKFHILDDYEEILSQKEENDFNERFFLDVKESSKIHLKKNPNLFKGKGSTYKKNVQNNYYYINGEGKKMKGLPNDPKNPQFNPNLPNNEMNPQLQNPDQPLPIESQNINTQNQQQQQQPIALGYN